ncbi:MAG: flagellar hook-associated protein FlgK [Lachnospiraceae bacterium]|uniref:Flagellar hook-associated protein 1 n=1 Tax=Candidatus Weimeria bifida TaxID=2599074 RepID=A0A6N7J3C1_9FIRM|nr:flagellar hook-associated protein FlgK [Candidatus Weimeria bifida]RRF97395.1 MAG: flagellar hook-associated protein FlgK [Lachnospiraceae bacterium]
MASTFFGLGIAASGLNAFQAKINTTGNNVSNLKTEGYSRQQVNVSSAISLRAYTRYGAISTGVSTDSVTRMRDQYYNVKYWENQSNYGQMNIEEYYMKQIEDYFTDNASNPGFSTIYAKMFNALDTVKNNAGDNTKRAQFVSTAKELCDYFNQNAESLKTLQTDVNDQIKDTVDSINSIAKKISVLNKQINLIETEAGHPNANELRDQRELLIDQLSEYVSVETEEVKVRDSRSKELAKKNPNTEEIYTGATTFTVKVGGQLLVDNYDYNPLQVSARDKKYNQSDVDGLYDVTWAKDGRYSGQSLNLYGTNQAGKLRGLLEIRDGNDQENLQGTAELVKPMIYVTSGNGSQTSEGTISPNSGNAFTNDPDKIGQIVTNSDGSIVENPKGEYSSSYIKIKEGINITDADRMNMPEQGAIYVNNHKYEYNSFFAQTDESGKVVSYIFELKEPISAKEIGHVAGHTATVGSSVDFKGIPYYQNEMNAFLRKFAKAFNKIQKSGQDANGDSGRSIFVADNTSQSSSNTELDFTTDSAVDNNYYTTDANKNSVVNDKRETVHATKKDDNGSYKDGRITGTSNSYYKLTASDIKIADAVSKSPSLFSTTINKSYNGNKDLGYDTYDIMQQMLDLEDKTTLYKDGTGDKFLQRIYADVTVDTQECTQFTKNYKAIQKSIDTQRQSVSGVDKDEEAMNLVKFLNAYNLSCKVISTLSEMYDQLILRTGV